MPQQSGRKLLSVGLGDWLPGLICAMLVIFWVTLTICLNLLRLGFFTYMVLFYTYSIGWCYVETQSCLCQVLRNIYHVIRISSYPYFNNYSVIQCMFLDCPLGSLAAVLKPCCNACRSAVSSLEKFWCFSQRQANALVFPKKGPKASSYMTVVYLVCKSLLAHRVFIKNIKCKL